MTELRQWAEDAVQRSQEGARVSYPVEVFNEQNESRAAIAVEKGTVDGKEIVRLADGTLAENRVGKLYEYDGDRPIGMVEGEEEPAALGVPDLKNVGDPAGHVAGTGYPADTTAAATDEAEEADEKEQDSTE